MATALARPVAFLDIGFSEQDQDPNSALLELDRGKLLFQRYKLSLLFLK